ncbi:MAG: spore cortex biosynthesis protein YabQ [Oscillospiraceae bacterium]
MYLPTMALQTRIFFLSIGLGFSLGFLYDIFYIVRMNITKNKFAIYMQDFLYLLICAFLTFIFILALSSGIVRGYILIGEFFGWLIYYLSTGLIVVSFINKIIRMIKLTIKKTVLLIIMPFKWITKKFCKLFRKIKLLLIKINKKLFKKTKRYLKYGRNVVYNTIDMVGGSVTAFEGNDKV